MELKNYITDIQDFPISGVNFKDISPLLATPDALEYAISQMKTYLKNSQAIVAIDARGFIFGSILSRELHIPLILARKEGKLPGSTQCVSYGLEYGKNTLCIQKTSLLDGKRVSIIDDVLATGGTALATSQLVQNSGASVENLVFLIEIDFLGGREKLKPHNVHSLINY